MRTDNIKLGDKSLTKEERFDQLLRLYIERYNKCLQRDKDEVVSLAGDQRYFKKINQSEKELQDIRNTMLDLL